MDSLSKKDRKILEMRLEGYTQEEIADKLGYKNHSGVQKRIGLAYQEFSKVDLGFDEKTNTSIDDKSVDVFLCSKLNLQEETIMRILSRN